MKAILSNRIKDILRSKGASKALMEAIFAEKRGKVATIEINGENFKVVRTSERE